jgi:hypothetical protein
MLSLGGVDMGGVGILSSQEWVDPLAEAAIFSFGWESGVRIEGERDRMGLLWRARRSESWGSE